MAIAIRAVGTWAAGTANLTVTIPSAPAAPQAGDMMVMFYGTKPYTDNPTIGQSWVNLGAATDGTVAAGNDVGSMQARIFYKVHTGSETNPVVTNNTNNVSGAVILVFSKASNKNWDTPPLGFGGGDASAGTGFSAASANTSIGVDDMIAAFAALRSDAAVQSGISLSASGITFSAFTESPASDLASISGGDIAASGGYASITAGNNSSVAVTYASTLAAAHTGSWYGIRLREVDPPPLNASSFFLVF
jgi:hypothetical protein